VNLQKHSLSEKKGKKMYLPIRISLLNSKLALRDPRNMFVGF
jgi:hypothetical protein